MFGDKKRWAGKQNVSRKAFTADVELGDDLFRRFLLCQKNRSRLRQRLDSSWRDFGRVLAHAELVELEMFEARDAGEPQCVRTAFERTAINHE